MSSNSLVYCFSTCFIGTTIVFELVERLSDPGSAPQRLVNMYYNLKPLRFLNKSYTDTESVPPPDVLVSDDDPYIIKMDLAAGVPLSRPLTTAAVVPVPGTAASAAADGQGVAPKGKHVVHHGISVEQFKQLMK